MARHRWKRADTWTGPRTARGKRRSSLNRMTRGLCPGWVAQELRARGESPEDFRKLHRDLIGYLRPGDARSRVIVESLAEAWWQKMRRLRSWVGVSPCDTKDIDAQIDDLLQRLVWAAQYRHRMWRYRLESEMGKGLYGPAVIRIRLESWVPALGGKPSARPPYAGRDLWRDMKERLAGLTELLSSIPRRTSSPAGPRPE